MEIKKIYLGHFGKFHNQEIELAPGINIIYGANEAGKSTIHSFVRGMFFGIEKRRGRESKDDLYARYQPWEMPGAYQGSMLVEKDGRLLQISRSFLAKGKSCSIIDLATGRELSETELEKGGFFSHFNELVYRNTISIEQLKSGTDKDFAKELQNFIANLSTAQSSEVDIANAQQFLKNKKKELEKECAGFLALAKEQAGIIRQMQEKVEHYDLLSAELEELLEERQAREQKFQQEKQGFFGRKTAELSGMLEKTRSYHALEDALQADGAAIRQMEARIHELAEGTDSQSMEEDLRRLNRLQEEEQEFERKLNKERDKEEACLEAKSRRNRAACAAVAAAGLLCTVGMAVTSHQAGIGIGIALMLLGGILYLALAARAEKKYQSIQRKEDHALARQLEIGGKRKEILVRNYVMDTDSLRKKCNVRLGEEAELRQLKERRGERIQERDARSRQKEQLFRELADFASAFGMKELPEGGITPDAIRCLSAQVEGIRQKEESVLAEYQEQREESLKREERIRWAMGTTAGAAAEKDEIAKQREDNLRSAEAAQTEIRALELAMSTIQELAAEIHDSFGEKLNQNISEKVREITDGKYSRITIDEQMTVKVLSADGVLTLDKLSAGTNCQIYLALRLAMAEIFFPEDTMPLIFDDAFALYDNGRLESALRHLAGRKNQLLLFTCHTREQELLRKMGIPCHEVIL